MNNLLFWHQHHHKTLLQENAFIPPFQHLDRRRRKGKSLANVRRPKSHLHWAAVISKIQPLVCSRPWFHRRKKPSSLVHPRNPSPLPRVLEGRTRWTCLPATLGPRGATEAGIERVDFHRPNACAPSARPIRSRRRAQTPARPCSWNRGSLALGEPGRCQRRCPAKETNDGRETIRERESVNTVSHGRGHHARLSFCLKNNPPTFSDLSAPCAH